MAEKEQMLKEIVYHQTKLAKAQIAYLAALVEKAYMEGVETKELFGGDFIPEWGWHGSNARLALQKTGVLVA